MIEIGRLTRLILGYVGETNSREIEIDVSEWLRQWPGAAIAVWIRRPDKEGYWAATEVQDGVLRWTVTAGDVAQAGDGMAQVTAIDRDTDAVYKSKTVGTKIYESLEEMTSDPGAPDPMEAWANQAASYKADAETARTGAESAQAAAQSARRAAVEAQEAATNEAARAAKAAENAEAAAKRAEDAEASGGGGSLSVDENGDATIGGAGLTVNESGDAKTPIRSLNGHMLMDEEARRRVDALSEEMAKQATPEYFGAKGDGVTDDSAAIAQALASGQTVVFDGAKTYAVGSTITIPADSFVDFRGATVVPKGNHDVIRVKPGSRIENLIVRCTDVSDWDSSAMVFYGGDMYRASNPTRINNVKMYNDVAYDNGILNKGNGLYLYVDAPGQFVEGLGVADLMTTGFGKGIYMQGLDASHEFDANSSVTFIGANNFSRYWSFKDTYGIYIDHDHTLNRLNYNHFTDLSIQSDFFGGTKYGIYCNGVENYFSGCLYDFFYLDRTNPIKAVYFGIRSSQNVIEVSAGVTNELGYLTDLGTYNRVVKHAYKNTMLLPNGYSGLSMIGNQDDILAFADKNMTCTLESLDGEPYAGELSNVFDPTPYKFLTYSERIGGTSNREARITINFKKAIAEISSFVLQFVRRSEPSTVRVTFYGDAEVRTMWETTENKNHLVVITPFVNNYSIGYENPVTNVAKIVIELGGFANPDGFATGLKEWCLERILATGTDATGNTWLRRDGGKVFGNVVYAENCGPVLTGADGKKYMLTVSASGTMLPVEVQETEEDAPDVALLVPTMSAGASWYDAELAGVEQSAITSVTFDATYEATGNEDASWFCDKDGVGHIIAFRNGTSVVIVPTTGSENIQLNEDSKYMFANDGTNANFSALASITGTEMWTAKHNTDMSYICKQNTLITNPVHIPDGVTYMEYSFNGCSALTAPPELPEGIVSIRGAFLSCPAMQNLPDLPSTVTNMNYAFQSCSVAKKVPSVIPTNVHSMENAFRACFNINGTIEVNTTKLSNYAGCFHAACAHSGAVVLTGSCTLLAELAATNADGKVTVASLTI